MADLFITNRKINSVFQLLGQKEDDISYAVGYTLSQCDIFLKAFLKECTQIEIVKPNQIEIRLQQSEKGNGETDFEIIQIDQLHIIVEAKRGWNFPSEDQLIRYANKPSFIKSKAQIKKLVVFNESTTDYAKAHFTSTLKNGDPIQVISWRKLGQLAQSSLKTKRHKEKNILKELINYLDLISTMQKIDSNWVYVVSLGNNAPDGWKISWQDIVNKRKQYFHPVGGSKGGWPKEPPNYIAFRYNGRLQSIHHIEKYQVFDEPHEHFLDIPEGKWPTPHYLYFLGEAIKPSKEVRTGKKVTRSMRVWAMLDLLLTSDTIGEARDLSKSRESRV